MTRKLRICLATDSPDPSGLGVHLVALADGAAAEGHQVTVAAPAGTGLLRHAAARGLTTWRLEPESAPRWFGSHGYDVVHVHAGIGWEGHGLTQAAAASGAAVVRTEHLPYLLTDSAQQAQYSERSGDVDAVVAVSESVAASYRPHVSAPLRVIANGVAVPEPSVSVGTVRSRLGLAGRPVLLHIGRFTPQKRHDVLLEALALSSTGAHLLLVGSGPGADHVAQQVHRLGLAGRVTLLGQRPDVGDLMRAADLLVLPSAFEGMPLVLLEAMSVGLPAVVTDAPGIRDIADEASAWVVPVDDAPRLAAALDEAIADPVRRTQLADAGRERYQQRHTLPAMQQSTLALYRSLAPGRKPMPPRTRVVLVGAGGIAHRHAGVLETMPDVEVVAVADPDLDRATELAERLGARAFSDPAEMLSAVSADAAFICVPPFAHGVPEDLVIAHHLPFLVEKPVGLDLATAERIAAESAGLVTAVGYHWRYLDVLDDVRRAFEGRPPRLATGVWYGATPPPRWWWSEQGSGGQMVEQTTHLVDLVRHLMGEVTTVFGLAERTERPDLPGLDVPTSSTATLLLRDGAIATFASTCLLTWQHRAELHLFGPGVAVELTDHDVMVDVGSGRPCIPNPTDPVWQQDRDFVDAVQGKENRIRCPYPEAVETLRVTLAIAEAARTGAPVQLDLAEVSR